MCYIFFETMKCGLCWNLGTWFVNPTFKLMIYGPWPIYLKEASSLSSLHLQIVVETLIAINFRISVE